MAQEHSSILVGIDLSAPSERALAKAVELAQRLKSELHVVYVFEPLTVTAHEPGRPREDILSRIAHERSGRHTDGAALCQRVIADRVPYTFAVVDAMAIDGLLDSIRKLAPEMVVVGSHGHGVLKRMLLGSVSTALCHRSPVPVMVVPGPGGNPAHDASDAPLLG